MVKRGQMPILYPLWAGLELIVRGWEIIDNRSLNNWMCVLGVCWLAGSRLIGVGGLGGRELRGSLSNPGRR